MFGFFLNNQIAIHADSAFYKYAELHSELHKNKPKNKCKLQTEIIESPNKKPHSQYHFIFFIYNLLP